MQATHPQAPPPPQTRVLCEAEQEEAAATDLPPMPTRTPSTRPPSFTLPSRKPITPGTGEVLGNPRSRSAKLRVGLRTMHAPLYGHLLLPPAGR